MSNSPTFGALVKVHFSMVFFVLSFLIMAYIGYHVIGGINLPKIIDCLGSDGKVYRQLVKGKDDLRQDAVMEQTFILVNDLLRKNRETRQRNLSIRTYRVIPLHSLAGILEWVDNTIPIGDYLVPAHERYHPSDKSPRECRQIMKKEFERKGSNAASKFQVFTKTIMPSFRPVFRYFFLEKYRHPAEWVAKRLAYTRSVAATSILGYVVGLGDRHCQNLLIDRASAEIVHIDLNLIFDQGKMLRIPEQVPFRLTRDIIDGMGSCGVEGTFRRCCEVTMGVLKAEGETLLTILEVFRHDPLYKWTLR